MKSFSNSIYWVIIGLCWVLSECQASAGLLYVDINGQDVFVHNGPTQTDVVAGENWHGLNIPLFSNNTSVTGTFGGFVVTVSSAAGFDSRDRGSSGLSGSYANLFRDFAVAALETTTVDLSVSGLAPSTLYDIRLQSYDSGVNAVGTVTWTDTTSGGLGNFITFAWSALPDPSASLLNDSGVLVVRTDSTGAFTVSGQGDQGGARLNGFELDPADVSSVPEPESLTLLGIGAFFLLVLAKRRHSSALAGTY